jgi:hypothetical protein
VAVLMTQGRVRQWDRLIREEVDRRDQEHRVELNGVRRDLMEEIARNKSNCNVWQSLTSFLCLNLPLRHIFVVKHKGHRNACNALIVDSVRCMTLCPFAI